MLSLRTRFVFVTLSAALALCSGQPRECAAQGSVPIEEAPPPLSPEESAQGFQVADGLKISLVAAEPDVCQPLSICFDDRGRMWVLQYRQFPNPNGLTPVKVDNWLRTKYDRLPDPPPRGPKGQDRISIYEDTNGDGRADLVKEFLSDLNLASGMALGHGGVFVAQPPYLLFYADHNHDDLPDGDPEVLLTGFGMEDAHAFANSLTWGPDGWLYGAQGSTATAEIRGIGFQQGVWRYHPLTKEFELFAEGGGNSWGIDFDRHGNLFAAGNTVEPLVHHVQGAYYVKGFGKHGPLHNPHAYGYIQPVQHHGYVGDSLTGGAVLYQGGAFPPEYNGACIAPNTRHSACRWSTVEVVGSTFATRHAGDFITSRDIWFRPVDQTTGPDGAVYVADWYDYNISHSSPKNRSEWYQPSRHDGRVWRVAPPNVPPPRAGQIDLAKLAPTELIALLSHPNDWYARQARRIMAERRDPEIARLARPLLTSDDQRLALQGMWAIYVSDQFDDALAAELLSSPHDYVRAWTVRLLGDPRTLTKDLADQMVRLSRDEPSVIVRSQLACSAKRWPAAVGLPIVSELLRRDEDLVDRHVPLLLWWAVEDKSVGDMDGVLRLVESPASWTQPLVREVIVERLARRLMAEDTEACYGGCARLLALAPALGDVDRVLSGMLLALSGRKLVAVPTPLVAPLASLTRERAGDAQVLQIALRLGSPAAPALDFVAQTTQPAEARAAVLRVLGETRPAGTVEALLPLLRREEPPVVHDAAIAALGNLDDEQVAVELLSAYERLPVAARGRILDALCSRAASSRVLLAAVQDKRIDAKSVPLSNVQQILSHGDEALQQEAAKLFGRVQTATPLEMQGRISAVLQLLDRAAGDSARGAPLYEKACATCHKLHGRGNAVGPDLTGAERKDRVKLIAGIVDPSAVIRQEFIPHVAQTVDGRMLVGLLAESTPESITLLDAKNQRTVLGRGELEELSEASVSLMPEKLLDVLSDQQIRDLVAFLQADPAN